MLSKYIKPKSLTFWASVTPFALGVFVATEPMHGLSDAVLSVKNATGQTATVLITTGLAGIGLRGAIPNG